MCVPADSTKLVLFIANAFQAWQTNIRMKLHKSENLPSLDYLVRDLTHAAWQGNAQKVMTKQVHTSGSVQKAIKEKQELGNNTYSKIECPHCHHLSHEGNSHFHKYPDKALPGQKPHKDRKVARVDYL